MLVHVGSVRLTYVYVTLVQMCPLYTSRCSPPEHDVNCEEDHGFSESCVFSLCVITLCGMFLISLNLKNLSRQSPRPGGKYFLPGTVVYYESLFSAL